MQSRSACASSTVLGGHFVYPSTCSHGHAVHEAAGPQAPERRSTDTKVWVQWVLTGPRARTSPLWFRLVGAAGGWGGGRQLTCAALPPASSPSLQATAVSLLKGRFCSRGPLPSAHNTPRQGFQSKTETPTTVTEGPRVHYLCIQLR